MRLGYRKLSHLCSVSTGTITKQKNMLDAHHQCPKKNTYTVSGLIACPRTAHANTHGATANSMHMHDIWQTFSVCVPQKMLCAYSNKLCFCRLTSCAMSSIRTSSSTTTQSSWVEYIYIYTHTSMHMSLHNVSDNYDCSDISLTHMHMPHL